MTHGLRRSGMGFAWIVGIGLWMAGCVRSVPPLTQMRHDLEAIGKVESWDWSRTSLLDLTAAQRIALERNPDYQAAFQAVSAARMAYYQKLGAYLPSISADFNLTSDLKNNLNSYHPPDTIAPYDRNFTTTSTLAASWLLFDGLQREFTVLAARAALRGSEFNRADFERLLKRGVAYAYYDVLLGGAACEIAESDLEFQNSNLDQAQVRYRAGHISKSDLLNFRILRARSLCALAVARQNRDTALFALANLLGFPTGTLPDSVKFPGISDRLEALPLGVDFYMERALDRRPDLRVLAENVRITAFDRNRAIGSFLPTLTGFLNVGYDTNYYNYKRYSVDGRAWNTIDFNGGVAMNWLLFNGFARYNRFRQTAYLEREAQLRLDGAALAAIQEVRNAVVAFRTQLELSGYYREMMDWVFEQRQLTDLEYWAGHVTITRLNEAQSELVTSQNNFATSLIALAKARAQLAAAINGPVDEIALPEPPAPAGTTLDTMFDALEKQFEYSAEKPLPQPSPPGKDL